MVTSIVSRSASSDVDDCDYPDYEPNPWDVSDYSGPDLYLIALRKKRKRAAKLAKRSNRPAGPYASLSKSQRDSLLGRVSVPGTRVRLLSNPSKLPCPSFSLPAGKGAGKACPWSTDYGICAGCYAKKGRYVFRAVIDAARARLSWTIASMRTSDGRDAWVDLMVSTINATGTDTFRWHDSGDFFSPVYASMVHRVIQRTPNVRHWIPTRTWQAPWSDVVTAIASESNATVRPSALEFEVLPPVIPGMHAGSGAASHDFNCPAPSQGNSCQDCRRCWDDKQSVILYHRH